MAWTRRTVVRTRPPGPPGLAVKQWIKEGKNSLKWTRLRVAWSRGGWGWSALSCLGRTTRGGHAGGQLRARDKRLEDQGRDDQDQDEADQPGKDHFSQADLVQDRQRLLANLRPRTHDWEGSVV